MEVNCNVIGDLLPLYLEDMVSADSKALIEEHLADCAACRAQLEKLKRPPELPSPAGAIPLKGVKRALGRRRVITALLSASLALALVLTLFAYLTAPRFFRYAEDLLQVSRSGDGAVSISFAERVTGYHCTESRDVDTGSSFYSIEAWNTLWDTLFLPRGRQNLVLPASFPAEGRIYYTQNNGAEDVLIYGPEPPDGGDIISLPRLVLAQYFLLALLALAALLLARLFVPKTWTGRIWLDRLTPLPAAYLAAQLLTKGLTFHSYSAPRDLLFLVLVAAALCCAILCGGELYRAWREDAAG